MQITQLSDDRRPILVISHERSGTHFTMNAIARAFGYVSWPWIDFDRPWININYYSPGDVASALRQIADWRPANTVKSHHPTDFLHEVTDEMTRLFHVVYVYRNPADCLASYWRLLNTLAWGEGPKSATALEFATSPPMGRLMRYQYYQHGTMLDRWAHHVRGWTRVGVARTDVHLIRYEDLIADYAGTMEALGRRIGCPVLDRTAPPPGERYVKAGSVPFTPPAGADNRGAIAELALRSYPELMDGLGYGASLAAAS